MDTDSPSKHEKGKLGRWGNVVALIAVVLAGVSLLISYQNQKYGSAPNIQIISLTSSRSYDVGYSRELNDLDKLTIEGTLVIKNFGRASAQLIRVEWEPLIVGNPDQVSDMWLAISDHGDPCSQNNQRYYYDRRTDPILGITNTVIGGGEIRQFKLGFFGKTKLAEGQEIPNVRLSLTFSTGQVLTILPDIHWRGVTSSW